MERRTFLAGTGAVLLATPFIADAQQSAKKLPTLGILALAGGAQIGSNAQAAFFQGLGDLGWVEGRNLLVERRIVEAPDERLAQAATELVRLRVDVILAAAGPASLNAARGATKAIPIVMVASSRDPIGTGLIQSYARPAGNITGLVTAPEELTGKQLELLKTAVQGLSRVGFLHDATVGPFQLERATVETSGLRSCPMGRAYSAYMKRMASGWQGSAIRQELGWSELVRRPEPKAATGFWA